MTSLDDQEMSGPERNGEREARAMVAFLGQSPLDGQLRADYQRLVWAWRDGYRAALAAREEPQGDEFDTRGLREAVGVINAAVAVWRLNSPDEPIPVWAATNAVIQQISFVEGKSIGDVVSELQIDDFPPARVSPKLRSGVKPQPKRGAK